MGPPFQLENNGEAECFLLKSVEKTVTCKHSKNPPIFAILEGLATIPARSDRKREFLRFSRSLIGEKHQFSVGKSGRAQSDS